MTSWRLGNKPSVYGSGHCGVWLPLSPLSAPRGVVRRRLFARRLSYVRCGLLLKPAVLPGLQHLLPEPESGLRKVPPNRQRERLSHSENEGHAIKEDGRRETLVHWCHPLSARPTLSAAEHCPGSVHTCPVIEVRLCCSEAFYQSLSSPTLPVAKDRRRRTGLKSSHIGRSELLSRMPNMRLLQKVQTYFRKPEQPAAIQRQVTAHDEQTGSSRSKRAQIRDVLRQYERGSLKEAEAVDELLKILR